MATDMSEQATGFDRLPGSTAPRGVARASAPAATRDQPGGLRPEREGRPAVRASARTDGKLRRRRASARRRRRSDVRRASARRAQRRSRAAWVRVSGEGLRSDLQTPATNEPRLRPRRVRGSFEMAAGFGSRRCRGGVEEARAPARVDSKRATKETTGFGPERPSGWATATGMLRQTRRSEGRASARTERKGRLRPEPSVANTSQRVHPAKL